jgi:hypothetical protein
MESLTGHLQLKKLAYLCFQCLDHPPFSLDLAPSDCHLFPELKNTIEREVVLAKDLSAPRQSVQMIDVQS